MAWSTSQLAHLATLDRADQDFDEALRVLDADLSETVDRLQRIRAELAVILRHRAPAELPPGFGAHSRALTEAERSLVMIYSRVFNESAMDEVKRMVSGFPRTNAESEFDALAPDADRRRGVRRARCPGGRSRRRIKRLGRMDDTLAASTSGPSLIPPETPNGGPLNQWAAVREAWIRAGGCSPPAGPSGPG